MATVNLGRIKPVFKGAYAGGTAFVVDDIVTSGNETFICILASTGNATSNATYWTKLASKGADGTNGTDLTSTLSTRGDLVFKNASALARLAKGTAGQVLGQGSNEPLWVNGSGKTLTTQGDILYRDGSGLQRLAKGTANQTLQMNSGANAPNWTTVAAASAVAGTKEFFSYRNNNSSALNSGGYTELVFDEEKFDTENKYNVSTGRYTPGVAGLYYVFSNITVNDINGGTDDLYSHFRVNGSNAYMYGQTRQSGNGAGFNQFVASAIILLTSSSDYISAWVYHDAGGGRVLQGGDVSFFGYRLK